MGAKAFMIAKLRAVQKEYRKLSENKAKIDKELQQVRARNNDGSPVSPPPLHEAQHIATYGTQYLYLRSNRSLAFTRMYCSCSKFKSKSKSMP